MRSLVAALAIVAALAAPAAAQPKKEMTDQQRSEAEQLFRAGERAFKANQFENAARLFEQAYAVLPLPAIAFSTGQSYRLQYAVDKDPRRLKRAVAMYDRYITDEPKGSRVGQAARHLAELRPLLEEQERKAAIADMPAVSVATMIMVTTTTDVPGARVTVDGGAPETLPLMREVTKGPHRVVITADGYRVFDEKREAVEGITRVIEIDLVPMPAVVSLRADDGAQVSVDGRPAGVTPLQRPLELGQGKHLVTVTRRGHRPWSREVNVKRGQKVVLDASLERTGQRTVSYVVLAGAGVLAIAAGVTYGLSLKAGGDASELNDKRESEGLTAAERDEYVELVDRRDARLSATYILIGAAGAVAASGFLLYFMDNPAAEVDTGAGASLTVAPVAGAESLGLALGGRF